MVTLTCDQGYLTDCNDDTGWGETESSMVSTLTIDAGDIFTITGSPNDAGDEYVYYEKTLPSPLNTNIDDTFTLRYKTSEASNGLAAGVQLIFGVGDQWILGAAGTEGCVYSPDWTVVTGTITPGKSLEKVRIVANDNPDTITAGTFYVYFDFIMFHRETFTLPNIAYGMKIDFPPQEAIISIPGRDTQITQNLGTKSAIVTISCDLDQGDWKRTGDTIDGEVFLDMLHNQSDEPWQWLDTGDHQFKVSVHPKFRWEKRGKSTARILDLILKEYSLGTKANETYEERYGIGL